MYSLFLIKQDSGMIARSTNLKLKDENVVIKQLLSKMIIPSRKLFVESMLGIDQFGRYSDNKELIKHLFYKEQEAEQQKENKEKSGNGFMNKIFSFIISPRHCNYYFIFDSAQQIGEFIPVSVPAHLDSYIIYPTEIESDLKQKVLDGASLADVLSLCYAYMPNQSYGGMPETIYSGTMTEQEFQVLSEVMLNKPIFESLKMSQIDKALSSLSNHYFLN